MRIITDIIRIVSTLQQIERDTENCIRTQLGVIAPEVEAKLKREAPWTDRTGNACRTMECIVSEEKNKFYLIACGNMPYSPDLEFSKGHRYSILFPTIEEITPEVLQSVAGAINEQRGLSVE